MTKLFITVLISLIGLSAQSYADTSNRLKSPYPVFINLPQNMNISYSAKNCPKTPKAIHDMKYTSVYTDRSQGVSIVDQAAQKKYKKQINDIKKFEIQIYKWVEEIFGGSAKSTKSLTCSMKWLSDWADENSMLGGETNFQGEAVRKWTLAVISSHYLQIKNFKETNPSQKKNIEAWLKNLGQQVITDYQNHPDNKSRNNNHIYWAAWSVMITGVAINNKEFYEWGANQYKEAVQDIQEDGTLPLELARQSKAFLYHSFAAAPLVMIAETLMHNGYNAYGAQNNALQRLVELILNELDNNQEYLTKKTGIPQNLNGVITPYNLAWLEIYNARFKNNQAQKWLNNLRPMEQRRLGGNLTRLYAPNGYAPADRHLGEKYK